MWPLLNVWEKSLGEKRGGGSRVVLSSWNPCLWLQWKVLPDCSNDYLISCYVKQKHLSGIKQSYSEIGLCYKGAAPRSVTCVHASTQQVFSYLPACRWEEPGRWKQLQLVGAPRAARHPQRPAQGSQLYILTARGDCSPASGCRTRWVAVNELRCVTPPCVTPRPALGFVSCSLLLFVCFPQQPELPLYLLLGYH